MNMDDDALLSLAKSVVEASGPFLDDAIAAGAGIQAWEGREPKAAIDAQLSSHLVSELRRGGIPVLSEEADHRVNWREGTVWIVDPLDGTLNFIRSAGPSAVSVALWRDGRPVFGVLLDIATRRICWGGRDLGAWRDGRALRVSDVRDTRHGVLCTGIPSGFDFESRDTVARWVGLMSRFGKVRMIGSAASSLALLAAGAADCYCESNIKIWDVAAGLALAEGAGGTFVTMTGAGPTLDVLAMTPGLRDQLAPFASR
jgi:myo-inositol-1(or 4)-monophosphatase